MANTFIHLTEHMSPTLDGRGSDVFNQAKRLRHLGNQIVVAGRWRDRREEGEELENIQVYRVDFLRDVPGIPWAVKRYAITRSLISSLVSESERVIGVTDGEITLLGHHLYGGVAAARIARSHGLPMAWILYGTASAYGFLSGVEESILLHRFKGEASSFLLLEDGSSLISRIGKLVPRERRFVFNNAPSEEFKPGGQVRSGRTDGTRSGVFTYISTSSMIKAKGVGYTIKAFLAIQKEQESRLLLLGEGPLRPKYEAFVRRKGISGRVRFLGRVAPTIVRRRLLESDVLVASCPNNSNFGRNVMEAMSLGIPVIATNAGRTSDLLSHGRNCLIVPREDVDALAGRMMELYSNEALRNRLGRGAAEFAVEAFSWDKRTKTFDQALTQLST